MNELNRRGSKRKDRNSNLNGTELGSPHDLFEADTDAWSGNIRKSWDSNRFRASLDDGGTVLGNIGNDSENAHWIHRDKLARIESEELQQAATMYHRRNKENRSSRSRGRSHESERGGANGSVEPAQPLSEQSEPWPHMSTEQQEYDGPTTSYGDEGLGFEDQKDWDTHRPSGAGTQEPQQNENASKMYRNPGMRKSSTRIPTASPSKLPVSAGRLGRDTPKQRGRTLTNSSDTGSSSSRPRRASEPLSLDIADGPGNAPSAPTTGNRPGSRGVQGQTTKRPGTKSNTATTRKVSAPAGSRKPGPKSRAASSKDATQSRPTTRSGERVINRPEGDPPWLATMYKPDPRLPPEQQILPTHARRMQQEQWEREGKTAVMYDREFAPLAITPMEGRPARKENEGEQKQEQSQQEEPQEDKAKREEPKEEQAPQQPTQQSPPQKPPQKPAPSEGTAKTFKGPGSESRPSTSNGYSTMPRVQNSAPPISSNRVPNPNPAFVTTIEAGQPNKDENEKKKKKKDGCGCCVVM